jgi:long-chain acyl-CoA synthetase
MDFRRLFDIPYYQQARYPTKAAISYVENSQWRSFSTGELVLGMQETAAGLLQLGVKKGDRIAIMIHAGSAYGHFIDFGLQLVGAISVPLHASEQVENLHFILRDAEIRYAFVSDEELANKLQMTKAPALRKILTIKRCAGFTCFEDLLIPPDEDHQSSIQTFKAVIHEDDLCTIMYTSGTTGRPKGVMLSHKNIVSNIKAVIALAPINCDHTVYSYLPLSHIFERMATYSYIAVGASLYYAQSIETIPADLATVRPHYFTSVPRMLERFYEQLLEAGFQGSKVKRHLLLRAVRLGERYDDRRMFNIFYWLQLKLASIFIFRRWRKALGNRVLGIVVGAASLQEHLARLFTAAGIHVREGYGLTETSPVVSFNRFEPGMNQFGTVGIPVPGVEVRIENPDEDGIGEIIVQGPNVMLGYLNQPEETAAVIDPEGWFHTGDVGRMVKGRFLQLTDRKKDIFKTSSGKYVAPRELEEKLKSTPYIQQVMILGANRPCVGALIVPSFALLEQWCIEHGVHWTAPQYMVINPRVEQFYQKLIEEVNQTLKSHERIRTFTLLHEPWSIDMGAVTPTLKVVRPRMEVYFQREIEQMYARENSADSADMG